MEYRTLGRTGLRVSEIGLGGEWFNGLTPQESCAIVDAAQEKGINYIDIFMPQAPTRSNLGLALEGRREQFIIQGHLCTVFEDGQYYDTPMQERSYAHIFSAGNAIHMTGRCMYCNHCQPCPAHIDIAAVTKFLDLAAQQPSVPETVAQHYWSLSATAADCLMCGRCEPNCPFGVNIRANMAKARELFAQTQNT